MMKRILITVTEEQEDWLRRWAFFHRISKAEAIRMFIEEEMRKDVRNKDEQETRDTKDD